MLFNSPFYIFVFLPLVVVVYFWLNHHRLVIAGKSWLVLASLFFYGYWDYHYLMLIVSSMLVNYALGNAITRASTVLAGDHHSPPTAKTLLIVGIAFNLLLLGYFKYADFFLGNINRTFGAELPMLNLVLPLAISFFSFQQIAYLVDSYRNETREYDFLNYCLFVTFFPQLIAGPIVHHSQMMPQFESVRNSLLRWNHIAQGSFLFAIGLFKKIFIADAFAVWANQGFGADHALNMVDAWGTSLSYTLQLYYDFSGYSDMAIGAALLFNIRLPINFNSPYKALSIQDFWRRWHITLSTWLRDYLYIPLGGNQRGVSRTYLNLFITFLLGGLWHGAGWTFVLWGAMHGMAMALHRFWHRAGMRMAVLPAWLCTFLFVNVAWVFFRAENLQQAMQVLAGMSGVNGTGISGSVVTSSLMSLEAIVTIVVFAIVALLMPNALQISGYVPYSGRWMFKRGPIAAMFIGTALFYSLVVGIRAEPSVFLYFNF